MAFERRDVGALNFDRTVLLTPLFLRRLPRRCSGIAEWAEVPSRLQRSPALPTAGVQLPAAVRTTHEVGRHCGTASAAQRTHLLDLGDDTQQLVGGRDAGFHLRETVPAAIAASRIMSSPARCAIIRRTLSFTRMTS